jgi:ABC-type bacteriocin/lantibiotic exporter with double-glycine peptidase domain
LKPSFYKQETISSCLPACLRMVFSSFGFEIAEAELRAASDCTVFGTSALQAVDAARQFGFEHTAKHTLSLEQLGMIVESGGCPIVLVSMLPIDAIRETHALVVTAIGRTEIHVYDPAQGERRLALETFSAAWASRSNVAIIIER